MLLLQLSRQKGLYSLLTGKEDARRKIIRMLIIYCVFVEIIINDLWLDSAGAQLASSAVLTISLQQLYPGVILPRCSEQFA